MKRTAKAKRKSQKASERFAGYAIQEVLGSGSYGVVYKVSKGSRVYALKAMHGNLILKSDAHESFQTEIKALETIKGKPNVIQIHDAGVYGGIPYIVSELMSNGTLENALTKRKLPFSDIEAMEIMHAISVGLRSIHEVNLVHCDLKPSNIFIEADGKPIIGDFGLARPKPVLSQLIADNGPMGTFSYMAPEQFRGVAPTPESDVYAACGILYHMLTLKRPFYEAENLAALVAMKTSGPIPSPHHINPHVFRDTENLIFYAGCSNISSERLSSEIFAGNISAYLSCMKGPNFNPKSVSTQTRFDQAIDEFKATLVRTAQAPIKLISDAFGLTPVRANANVDIPDQGEATTALKPDEIDFGDSATGQTEEEKDKLKTDKSIEPQNPSPS